MNVKKIIKGIIGLGAIGGVAYAAYKLGECSGEVNERFREKYGDEDDEDIEVEEDDDYRFYDNMDEPDDECLAPKKQNMPTFSVSMHNFASLDSVHVDGISDKIWICLSIISRLTSTPLTSRSVSGLKLTGTPLQR